MSSFYVWHTVIESLNCMHFASYHISILTSAADWVRYIWYVRLLSSCPIQVPTCKLPINSVHFVKLPFYRFSFPKRLVPRRPLLLCYFNLSIPDPLKATNFWPLLFFGWCLLNGLLDYYIISSLHALAGLDDGCTAAAAAIDYYIGWYLAMK